MASTRDGRTNWFAIWVTTVAVAAVLAVTVLVVWMNNSTSTPQAAPQAAMVDGDTGAIMVGTGAADVEVYFDFYCPHCQQFEQVYGPAISGHLDRGDITLHMHPVALGTLNAASGTDFSQRSASALYCVAETSPEAAHPFMEAVFDAAPTGPGLTDKELIELASDVGATDITSCVTDRSYVDFVDAQTGSLPENPDTGSVGTPALLVNGEYVVLTGDPDADITGRIP